jgi:Signal transduction histidine kinase regulating C4-dicarboxylate transport system
MSTASESRSLPAPELRSGYPEVARAEVESLRLRQPSVSDAFLGRMTGNLVVTVASPIDRNVTPAPFVYFSISLSDIDDWLAGSALQEGEFAALADGSRRVIARSEEIDRFLLADIPEWYVAFTEGRGEGVAEGAPLGDGAPRLFAFQRLEEAPTWTLAISSPPPTFVDSAMRSAWPALSALATTIVGAILALLTLDRRRARKESAWAARTGLERERILQELRSNR